jgi:hypothetical protein
MLVDMIKRWLERGLLAVAVVFVAVYGGDWAVFKLRGSPQSKVAVSRYVAIPLKGNKQEFDYLGTADVACSVALFAQGGQNPCWQVRRNQNQGLTP